MSKPLAGDEVMRRAPREMGRRPAGQRRRLDLGPLPWIGPAVLLIFAVVLWPAVEMVRTSLTRISIAGVDKGFNNLGNYSRLLANPELLGVLIRTAIWVLGVVAVTVVISLFVAQLLNESFPGRRLVRWALIVPWAVSVVMTATIWRWILDNFYGVLNRILMDFGVISGPVNWLGDPTMAFCWLMVVAIFVSIPFTTFVILAGLQSMPGEIVEAARVDGANRWRLYWHITLPLLRPVLLVGTLINLINVFNSFPIIWVMTGGGPGFDTDTTTTFMYKVAFRGEDLGQAAAMAVLNFAMILVFVLLYLRAVNAGPREQI